MFGEIALRIPFFGWSLLFESLIFYGQQNWELVSFVNVFIIRFGFRFGY